MPEHKPDFSGLTMLDYIKRLMPSTYKLNKRAEELLSATEWPEDECECKFCARPETHQLYWITGLGEWLIGSRDHKKLQKQHPDWKQIDFPSESGPSNIP
jgi:hypothetical protein